MTVCQGKRIFIDATGASIGGGYTYLVNVISRICKQAPEAQFRLMLRHEGLATAVAPEANLQIDALPSVNVLKRLKHVYLDLPGIVKDWNADLYFSVGEVSPYTTHCPAIASFRNPSVFLPILLQPTNYERARVALLSVAAKISAKRCKKIMFVSDDSSQWIGDSLNMPIEKRATIHHGIDAEMWAAAPPFADHPRPYILTVGSIYPYKNFVRLIKAWTILTEENPDVPDLIIIGDKHDVEHQNQMEEARRVAGDLGSRVHLLGGIPYTTIQSYYAGAKLFVFPSYTETFGHPLLEAMAAGIPLVATDMPVFREIAEDAALYADAHDIADIARALKSALDPETASALIRKGNAQMKLFSWDRTATRLLALFESTMKP